MLIDFNAHYGRLPGYSIDTTAAALHEMTAGAGIDRVIASDIGAAFAGEVMDGPVARVYPTYQPCDLARALDSAAGAGLILQVYLRLRDPRVLRQEVPSVEVIKALDALTGGAGPRLIVSGANLAEMRSNIDFFRRPNVWIDTAHLQHPTNSLPKAVELLGATRILFGTNAPVFYPAAEVFRLKHSPLSDGDRELIGSANALRLLGAAG